MALDYAGIINAGAGLMGGLREQLAMEEQRKVLMQDRAKRLQQEQVATERMGAFRDAAQQAAHSADPKAIGDLMVQFPEFADQIKPAWQTLSDEARRRNLTQSGTIFVRAKNGDAKGAAALLRQRYEADMAAGHADPADKELIDALESGDPLQVQQATATVGMRLAADDPSKFSETYAKLFPADAKSTFSKEYEDRVRLFGKKAADAWVKVQDAKVFSVNPGGSLQTFKANTTGDPQNAEGGDQSTGGGGPNGNGTLTQAQFQAIVGTKGKKAALEYVRDAGLTVGGITAAPRYTATQTVSGTTYYQIDGRWFDNPEGR